MASVASELIGEFTAHAQNDILEDAREIRADDTYFPNNLRKSLSTRTLFHGVVHKKHNRLIYCLCCDKESLSIRSNLRYNLHLKLN